MPNVRVAGIGYEPVREKQEKMDGWMDIYTCKVKHKVCLYYRLFLYFSKYVKGHFHQLNAVKFLNVNLIQKKILKMKLKGVNVKSSNEKTN